MKPILATSDSNIAVDNIAEGAVKLGLKVIRVGRPEKITPALETVMLDNKLKEQLWDSKRTSSWGDDDAEQDKWGMRVRILKEADIICCTTTVAGSGKVELGDNGKDGTRFRSVLIDEVAQATELSALVPVVLRRPDRLVLVGDQCQLPPCVASYEASGRGLNVSMYERLVNCGGLKPFFLDIQYRMHPAIAEFSSWAFYDGQLKSGVTPAMRKPPRGFDWPDEDSGVAFIDSSQSWESGWDESKSNDYEVEVVRALVEGFTAAGELDYEEIGVVSPYKAQVKALKRALGSYGRRLEVSSVDGFQGREKELIVFSAVRSNNRGSVGFLSDARRLNVMATRSRRGLVVVGAARTLRTSPHWRRWLDHYSRYRVDPPQID
eukprot:TRINITY_DN17131_c0_g1_i1.p1 TRINITY_DN17131_c0_g1~~TRINITY_DN17131_c0_g1_i1.p1  ORF type:complete len:378 (-),score=68.80 TRINITY_DN17131_c0_g1_i1:12-1145(-)